MVTCTAMASGILLAILPGNLPFLPQNSVQLRIHELIPLAQVLALAAFVAHPKLHQNPPGNPVVFEMRGKDAVQAKILKSVAQHFSRSLCRIALSPVRHTEPVAEFAVLMLVVDAQPNAANLPPVSAEGDRQPDFAGLS